MNFTYKYGVKFTSENIYLTVDFFRKKMCFALLKKNQYN